MLIKSGDLVRIKYNDAIMELEMTENMGSNIVSPNSPLDKPL